MNKYSKRNSYNKRQQGTTVIVEHDNVQRAIKKLRRIIADNGILDQYHQHRYFIKNSVKRRKSQSLKKFKAKLWNDKQREKLENE